MRLVNRVFFPEGHEADPLTSLPRSYASPLALLLSRRSGVFWVFSQSRSPNCLHLRFSTPLSCLVGPHCLSRFCQLLWRAPLSFSLSYSRRVLVLLFSRRENLVVARLLYSESLTFFRDLTSFVFVFTLSSTSFSLFDSRSIPSSTIPSRPRRDPVLPLREFYFSLRALSGDVPLAFPKFPVV